MNYSFIESLKANYRVTELDHAFRINGVIDIFKSGTTVYEIPKNVYHKKLTPKMLAETTNRLLLVHPEQSDFKKAKNGISYQEFTNINKRAEYQHDTVHPEDHHWGINFLEKSEDHLYFAVMDDKVKIGRSIDPSERIKSLSTGLYKEPRVYVFTNKGFMETKLHHLFVDFRIKGEWFKFDIRIQHFLKKHHRIETGYIINPSKPKIYAKR